MQREKLYEIEEGTSPVIESKKIKEMLVAEKTVREKMEKKKMEEQKELARLEVMEKLVKPIC